MGWAATQVYAMSRVVVPQRLNDDGEVVPVTIPDHLDILCTIAARRRTWPSAL